MTPLPADDEAKLIRERNLDTSSGLHDETKCGQPSRSDQIDPELTDEERDQARLALAFLSEVRREQSQPNYSIPEQIGRYSVIRSAGRGGFCRGISRRRS